MDPELATRVENIIRGSLAHDVTVEISDVIDAVMSVLRKPGSHLERTTLLVALSNMMGQVAQAGVRDLHLGECCESCATRLVTDFSAGLGFRVDSVTVGDEPNDDADLEDIDIATVH